MSVLMHYIFIANAKSPLEGATTLHLGFLWEFMYVNIQIIAVEIANLSLSVMFLLIPKNMCCFRCVTLHVSEFPWCQHCLGKKILAMQMMVSISPAPGPRFFTDLDWVPPCVISDIISYCLCVDWLNRDKTSQKTPTNLHGSKMSCSHANCKTSAPLKCCHEVDRPPTLV